MDSNDILSNKRHPVSLLSAFFKTIRYSYSNRHWLKANQYKNQIAELLTRANVEIGRLPFSDASYAAATEEYNQAVIEAEKAKYFWQQAMETNHTHSWKTAYKHFKNSIAIARHLFAILNSQPVQPISVPKHQYSSQGAEIIFADGVPLVPEILPLIILQGPDFEMGYQYATQVVQIYGKWILERKAGRQFSPEEQSCLRKWEEQLQQYAPEILEMCKGWAAGARELGIPMTYDDVLDLWTGHTPPARLPYNLSDIGLPASLANPFCSGVAAWGCATVDGRLVTASTGDHNPSHAAVIIAYPQTGNSFIATPFHVTGDIRSAPPMFMMGHPGMNEKGLAYIEHGGEPRIAEPPAEWGYGIRKGAAIFHILRFANSAREAQQMELAFPVGDVGTVMGSAGGFWADSTYGYVSECRHHPIAIREAGIMGETDFLYACNGILHPSLKDVWWMKMDAGNWLWDEHGGWYPRKYKNFERGMMGNPREILQISASMIQAGNRERCLYYYEMMSKGLGRIDSDYMKMVLRCGGTPPQGSWQKVVRHFTRTGYWGRVSAAHSTNTITVVMRPDDNGNGIYSLCHGEAKRGLPAFSPKQVVYMYNETNAFWEIKLADDPQGLVDHARQKALEYMQNARDLLATSESNPALFHRLEQLVRESQQAFESGQAAEGRLATTNEPDRVYELARAARGYTRSQVRALQITQAVNPPPLSYSEWENAAG